MKQVLCILFAIMLILIPSSCSNANGYENIINSFCYSIENSDRDALVSLLDIKNIERAFCSFSQGSSLKSASGTCSLLKYNRQEDFNSFCLDIENSFGRNYSVMHNRIAPAENGIDLARLKKLRCLKNEKESPILTDFLNSFIDELEEILILNTTLVIKSKSKKLSSCLETTFHLYKANGRWYLDYINYSDIVTPNLLDIVEEMLIKRN